MEHEKIITELTLLKAQLSFLTPKTEGIDRKVDSLLEQFVAFKWKVIGAAAATSFIITLFATIGIEIVKAAGR